MIAAQQGKEWYSMSDDDKLTLISEHVMTSATGHAMKRIAEILHNNPEAALVPTTDEATGEVTGGVSVSDQLLGSCKPLGPTYKANDPKPRAKRSAASYNADHVLPALIILSREKEVFSVEGSTESAAFLDIASAAATTASVTTCDNLRHNRECNTM